MLNPYTLLLVMASTLFMLGFITCVTGVYLLAVRSIGRDVQALATQTTRMAQKGMADGLTGLVGNASSLLEALNQLTRTAAGVGVFLTLLGVMMMGAACWLAIQVIPMELL